MVCGCGGQLGVFFWPYGDGIVLDAGMFFGMPHGIPSGIFFGMFRGGVAWQATARKKPPRKKIAALLSRAYQAHSGNGVASQTQRHLLCPIDTTQGAPTKRPRVWFKSTHETKRRSSHERGFP